MRLLFTLALLALFIMTLVLWEHKGNVSHGSRRWFNTIATILNLALGLNFLEAFKDMAKVLRWRVLANRSFTVREADLILGGESLMKLCNLMWVSRKKPVTVFVCVFWIALNLLAQASIAMLSLNYSMDSGTDARGTYTVHGNVQSPQLDCFYQFGQCPQVPGAEMTYSNVLGQQLAGQRICPYNDSSQILTADQSCAVFLRQDHLEAAYRFKEYNPGDVLSAFPHLTNRTIRANVGQCYQYDIDWENSPIISDTDGKDNFNKTYTGHLPIPKSEGAFNSTTYVYNGTEIPRDETGIACGPRCLKMYALRLGDANPVPAPHIFGCEISISDVFNATQDAHQVGNSPARNAAASIALTGRFTTPVANTLLWRQYQLYTWGNTWEAYQKTANEVGTNMALSAISALAGMSNRNPRQLIPGLLPILGYHLSTNWEYVIALSVCIGVVHFLLILLMVWFARPLFVPDDSNLAVSRLLCRLVSRLGGRGSLLSGKELAAALQQSSDKNGRIVYGVDHLADEAGERVLELDENVPLRRSMADGRFPLGKYE